MVTTHRLSARALSRCGVLGEPGPRCRAGFTENCGRQTSLPSGWLRSPPSDRGFADSGEPGCGCRTERHRDLGYSGGAGFSVNLDHDVGLGSPRTVAGRRHCRPGGCARRPATLGLPIPVNRVAVVAPSATEIVGGLTRCGVLGEPGPRCWTGFTEDCGRQTSRASGRRDAVPSPRFARSRLLWCGMPDVSRRDPGGPWMVRGSR